MRRSFVRRLGTMAALVIALGAAPAALAGSASDPDTGVAAPWGSQGTILEHLTEGGSAVSLGFGVSPLRWQLAPAAVVAGAQGGESARPLDSDLRATVVSFDLTLKWPGAETTALVEPYVVLGPALFVVEPDYAGRLRGTRVDPTLRLGAKAGAGVNWRLGKNATVFGAYEVTTAGQGGLTAPGATAPADTGITGYDLTYGLRFRY